MSTKVAIYEAVKAGNHTAQEIAAATGINPGTVWPTLTRLVRDGSLSQSPRRYANTFPYSTLPRRYEVLDG